MNAYQTFGIRGPHHKLVALPDEIEKVLDNGWSRNFSAEAAIRRSPSAAELFCFHCEAGVSREVSDLWLVLHAGDELHVSNIVPCSISELSHTEYNAILREFAERFAAPAAKRIGLMATMSKPDLRLLELLHPDTANALSRFSGQAVRVAGGIHLQDKERWETFVIGAHRTHAELDSDTLGRWLTEEGWPADAAQELGLEYEQGRSLLEQYERQLQNA